MYKLQVTKKRNGEMTRVAGYELPHEITQIIKDTIVNIVNADDIDIINNENIDFSGSLFVNEDPNGYIIARLNEDSNYYKAFRILIRERLTNNNVMVIIGKSQYILDVSLVELEEFAKYFVTGFFK